jgi:hypothetical protein
MTLVRELQGKENIFKTICFSLACIFTKEMEDRMITKLDQLSPNEH